MHLSRVHKRPNYSENVLSGLIMSPNRSTGLMVGHDCPEVQFDRQRVISDLKLEDTKRKDSNTAILILNFTFKICLI